MSSERSLALAARGVALVAAGLMVGVWLVDILSPGDVAVPAAVSRVAILAFLAAAAWWLGAGLAARVAGRRGRELAVALLLPGLLALALLVRLAGVESEVGGRYYLDEGTYYHHAAAIDEGEVLRRTFVYPHFTYYADALVLWSAARFPTAVAAAAHRLYGLDEPLAVSWLLLRCVVALLSALTVVPVYRIASRLARGAPWVGRAAGSLAALLLIFCDLFNEGSHLNTCDVPSAFFATLCLWFVSSLVERETRRDYMLAGVAAGLACASKYPAALVAIAIAVVWAGWRLRRRDWSFGLVWAAVAAVATVIVVMPSLLAYPALAFTGSRGIFFGARQYGKGGWLGVMPDSNLGFYAAKLAASFGWPALAAGLSGLVLFLVRGGRGQGSRARLGRLLWMAPFPVVFLLLIVSMNMVVKRNLYPALPMLAVYLGVGMAAWLELAVALGHVPETAAPSMSPADASASSAASAPPARRRRAWVARTWVWAPALLIAACLVPPGERVFDQTVGYVTPTTREEAAAWIVAHLPAGVSILKEAYTPDLSAQRFEVSKQRFVARIPIADLRAAANDYLLLASSAYSRFSDAEALFKESQHDIAHRYDEIFRTFPLVREWTPDDLQLGPVLRLYRIDPDPAACLPTATLAAADAFPSDEAMRTADERPLRYTAEGQWILFHACLPAGRYRLGLLGGGLRPPAQVRVRDAAGHDLAALPLVPPPGAPQSTGPPGSPESSGPSGAPEASATSGSPAPPPSLGADLVMPRLGKVLLYVYLPPASRLRALSLQPEPAP
jgi:hypothetical protein